MLLHLSALIALLRGLSLSPPRCPCPVFCLYLSVEACLSPSLPFAVFALRLVGCDNVCCSSLVLSLTAGSRRFPAVNSQSIYVPFGLVNSKKKKEEVWWLGACKCLHVLQVLFFFVLQVLFFLFCRSCKSGLVSGSSIGPSPCFLSSTSMLASGCVVLGQGEPLLSVCPGSCH